MIAGISVHYVLWSCYGNEVKINLCRKLVASRHRGNVHRCIG